MIDESNAPLHRTGKLAYMAMSLHLDGQHSCETDMESLFYSLLDVMSNGHALLWRHLEEHNLIYSLKFMVVHDNKAWDCKILPHCRGPLMSLLPVLQRVREVVRQQDASAAAYLTAFGHES